MTELALRTEGLVKDYSPVRALDGLDLEIPRGEVRYERRDLGT